VQIWPTRPSKAIPLSLPPSLPPSHLRLGRGRVSDHQHIDVTAQVGPVSLAGLRGRCKHRAGGREGEERGQGGREGGREGGKEGNGQRKLTRLFSTPLTA
jgi:hypothetical protein